MSNFKASPDIIKDFLATLPSQFKTIHQQALDDLKPKLEIWLSSLNLVGKTEFAAQSEVLERCQRDLAELKAAMACLENLEMETKG